MITTAGGTISAKAAKAATATIPIVFVTGADHVEMGLVASLNRPGSNVTGVALFAVLLEAKKLELLREMIPRVKIIALLVNPNSPLTEPETRNIQAAARAIGQRVHAPHAGTENDLEAAFSALVQLGAGALVVGADRISTAIAIDSSRWRPATRCPRFTIGASSRRPAAW